MPSPRYYDRKRSDKFRLISKNKSVKNQIIEFKDLVFNKKEGLKLFDKIYYNFSGLSINLN